MIIFMITKYLMVRAMAKYKYDKIFSDIKLNNGVVLQNRCALAPMLVGGASVDGTVDWEEVEYYRKRNRVGQLLIAGAASVSKYGKQNEFQNHIFEDEDIKELSKLAEALKEEGNKAILQIQHSGREAKGSYLQYGRTVAPTGMDFPWLDYRPEELSQSEIEEILGQFGAAARRAVEAGFDGVEIHGANHYLLQQFFSAYSNQRTDQWGGSLEKRMAFPVAVLERVKEVVEFTGKKDFIIGYRFCPEEVHGSNIGYTISDTLVLIDRLLEVGLDYLHSSTFSSSLDPGPAYKKATLTGNSEIPLNQQAYEHINGRCALVVCGQIKKPKDFLDALNYGDICAVGVLALSDPEYLVKMESGREDEIQLDVTGRISELGWTHGLIHMYETTDTPGLPPVKGFSRPEYYVEY